MSLYTKTSIYTRTCCMAFTVALKQLSQGGICNLTYLAVAKHTHDSFLEKYLDIGDLEVKHQQAIRRKCRMVVTLLLLYEQYAKLQRDLPSNQA